MHRILIPLSAAALLLSGCAGGGLDKRVLKLEDTVSQLDRKSAENDQRLRRLDNLDSDLDAIKAYFKEVREQVRAMRDDIVKLIDEQNLVVEKGRKEYLRILLRQKDMLDRMQKELDEAAKELNAPLPAAQAAVAAEPANPTLQSNNPQPPAAAPAAPAPAKE